MPLLTIQTDGETTRREVAAGTRLVNAIEQAGFDIGHRCGGHARCTTCRVHFIDGEPQRVTEAEHAKLVEKDLLGTLRLSCQILVDQDMTVQPLQRVREQGWPNAGPTPEPGITPEPVWR